MHFIQENALKMSGKWLTYCPGLNVLKRVSKDPIHDELSMSRVMDQHQKDNKPLSEPMTKNW